MTIIKSIYGADVEISKWSGDEMVVHTSGNGQRLVKKADFIAAIKSEGILGENATVVTDLPEVTTDEDGWPEASGYSRSINQNPGDLLENAKALLAIHAFLVKRNAEQEAAKVAEAEAVKAKEEANAKRRDELASELAEGDPRATYSSRLTVVKKAIDRIIELEEAAKVS